jgi:hypothetical protein
LLEFFGYWYLPISMINQRHHQPWTHFLFSFFQLWLFFSFFFPSLLVGPAIPFSDYSKFTTDRDQGLALRPGREAHALRKIATGLLFAALVGLYGGQWSYERVLQDDFLAKSWRQRWVLHPPFFAFIANADSNFACVF